MERCLVCDSEETPYTHDPYCARPDCELRSGASCTGSHESTLHELAEQALGNPATPVGALLGFGNGMGSGIVMTLGSDFAPASGRAAFLGVWRFLGDVGTAGGPLVVGAVAGALSLGAASSCIGVIGLAGAVLIATRVPEPLHAIRAEAALPDPGAEP